jgi:hypothetical protein
MDDDRKWRIGLGAHLRGATLRKAEWRAPSDDWDHDHCSCCWAKFAEFDGPGILHEGYTSTDGHEHGEGHHWICEKCFIELKFEMRWQLAASSGPNS